MIPRIEKMPDLFRPSEDSEAERILERALFDDDDPGTILDEDLKEEIPF